MILHHGPPAAGLPFEERIKHSRMAGCLVIVPTKRRIRHLTREIMRLSPGAVAPALPLHTFESLCRLLYGALPSSRSVLGENLRTLLMSSAASSVSDSLGYFSPTAGAPSLPRGTFARVVDVITLLKEAGVYVEHLEEELESSAPGEHAKLRDVAAIYAAYENALQETGCQDLEGIYRSLYQEIPEELFRSTFRRRFPDVEFVSLAGFDEFSAPEIRVLRRLCAVPGISVTLMFDYLPGNRELFGHLEENYRLFTELGFHEIRGEEAKASAFFFGFTRKPAAARNAAEHLARRLFNREGRGDRTDISAMVTVMSARNRVHEIELICKLIRRLIADRPDRPLGSICCAIQSPELYTEIVREQFSRFAIPANITDRFELTRSPLIVHVLGLLEVPLRGFRRRDVLRVVSSPYFRFPVHKDVFDAGNLSVVAARVRATAGLRTWLDNIDHAIAESESVAGGSGDAAERGRALADVSSLRKARSDIVAFGALLTPFDELMTAEVFVKKVCALLDSLDVPRLLVGPAMQGGTADTERDVRAFTAFRAVLEDLATMAALAGENEERLPLRIHLDRLRIAVSRERYNIREQFGRGVLVTSIEETRELPVEVMIVTGLVDGEFPSVYQPEVFFSARRMRAREQRHTWENRYLFYQAATNWTEHLYLTYPIRDAENELVRSPFVDAVIASADVERWESVGHVPCETDVSSTDEFLQLYAEENGNSLPIPPSLTAEAEYVCRASAIEHGRTMDEVYRSFRGSILGELDESERNELRALGSRTYSVSQLETFASCPFKYFSQTVLRLVEVGTFDESLSPLEKGSIIHEALYEFSVGRRAKSLPPIKGLSGLQLEEAIRDLTEIVRPRLNRLNIPDPLWELEKELIVGSPAGGEGLLRRFLEFESRREDELVPSFFEVSFGGTPGRKGTSDTLLSQDEPILFGGVRLRGKIDRVELGDGIFAVVDYKTGSVVPALNDIRGGLSLQLPLYLHAVEHLLEASGRPGMIPAGGLYYRLRSQVDLSPGVVVEKYRGRAFPKGSRTKQKVEDERELREIIGGAEKTVRQISERIAMGEFPLATLKLVPEVCPVCPYKTVCRIQIQKHVSPVAQEES